MATVLKKTNLWFTTLLVAGIVIAANILLSGIFNPQLDLTQNKVYTLSEGTKTILKDLEQDVELKFHFSRSLDGMPKFATQKADLVEDLLAQYQKHSNGRIKLEIIDPKPDTEEQDRAESDFGIRPVNAGLADPVYFGIAARSLTEQESIPFLDLNQEDQWEYSISEMITKVVETEKPVLGIMSSLDVMGGAPPPQIPGMPPQQQPAPKWAFITDLEALYEIRTIPMETTDIENDIAALVLIHPKNVGEKTLFAIDQFIMDGGRVCAFLDPRNRFDSMTSNPQFRGMIGSGSSELNALTKTWGFTLDSTKMIADLGAGCQDPFSGTPSLTVLRCTGEGGNGCLQSGSKLTDKLTQLDLHYANAFDGEAAEGLTMTPLIMTTENAAFIPESDAMKNAGEFSEADLKDAKARPIAMMLEGTFTSSFPDGLAEMSDEEKQGVLKESKKGLVALVADSDLLVEPFNRQQQGPFMMSLNNNFDFVQNLIGFMGGNANLIEVRSRRSITRPFTKIDEIEREAMAKRQSEREEVEANLTRLADEINKLQAGKDRSQMFVLSPEQQQKLENMEEEQVKARKAIRELNKEQREEIESLGSKLKLLNIGGIPLLVGLLGLFVFITRGARGQRKG